MVQRICSSNIFCTNLKPRGTSSTINKKIHQKILWKMKRKMMKIQCEFMKLLLRQIYMCLFSKRTLFRSFKFQVRQRDHLLMSWNQIWMWACIRPRMVIPTNYTTANMHMLCRQSTYVPIAWQPAAEIICQKLVRLITWNVTPRFFFTCTPWTIEYPTCTYFRLRTILLDEEGPLLILNSP